LDKTNAPHRILIIGCDGQLGFELQRTLPLLGNVIAIDFPQIDLANLNQVRETVQLYSPQIIVNAAAYTNVDQAESEPDIAMKINGLAPGVLAEEAQISRAVMIHYSTDYVFDGEKGSAYREEDKPNPLNIYGISKLAGENSIKQVDGNYLIFRTSWLYSLHTNSFVTKVLDWSRKQKVMRVVADQVGSPTWSRMLAEATAYVLAQAVSTGDINTYFKTYRGLYHLAGDGEISRYEFAKAILEYDSKIGERIVQEIQPALTSEFSTPAQRPLFSALNCDLAYSKFKIKLPPWKQTLRLAMSHA